MRPGGTVVLLVYHVVLVLAEDDVALLALGHPLLDEDLRSRGRDGG